MEKIDVVLILLNRDALEATVKNLNHDRANLVAIVADGYGKKNFTVGKNKIPVTPFATIHKYLKKKFFHLLWLICGGTDNDLRKTKKILTAGGIPEGNIVNFNVASQSSVTWLANLRHIDEHGADFFVTGNEYVQVGVNLNLIPHVHVEKSDVKGGVILADTNQTLRHSYLIAKHVFEHVAPDTIKFVLIGLVPHALHYDDDTNFLYAPQNLQYGVLNEPTSRDELLMNLVSDDIKKIFSNISTEQADLNFDDIKSNFNRTFSVGAIEAWDDVPQNLSLDNFDNNIQIFNDYATLKDYIELCLANGAKPIGVVLPFSRAVRKYHDNELLTNFRKMIRQLEKTHDFTCVDMFELNLNYDCFCDMTHLNAYGQIFVNSYLAMKLHAQNLIPTESFCDMNYYYFYILAWRAPKDEYNALMEQIFSVSAKRISCKKKIRVGFVMLEAAHWCGKDLYDFFEQDKRFETTVFLCMDFHKNINELVKEDFQRGVEQLRAHGLNVVAIDKLDAQVPTQDVLIYLSIYANFFPSAFYPASITAHTLVTHIPYSLDISVRKKKYYNQPILLGCVHTIELRKINE